MGFYLFRQAAPSSPVLSSPKIERGVQHKTARSYPKKICVDVKGAVNRPGVYYLSHGSRVQEAIEAAGGQNSHAELKNVNLAKELQDQQMVYIPAQGEELPTNSASVANSDTNSETVNINTANKEELQKLDGIGDKKAEKIIEYRQQHGQFKSADDLKNVSGFGDKTVARLKDQITV